MIIEPFPLVTCSGCYGVHPYGQCPNKYYYPTVYPSYPFHWYTYTTTESVKEEKVIGEDSGHESGCTCKGCALRVKTPEHYDMPIPPIKYIMENKLGFCEGNVVKYVSRYKNKGGIEDLKKARHYIDMLIAQYDTEKHKV